MNVSTIILIIYIISVIWSLTTIIFCKNLISKQVNYLLHYDVGTVNAIRDLQTDDFDIAQYQLKLKLRLGMIIVSLIPIYNVFDALVLCFTIDNKANDIVHNIIIQLLMQSIATEIILDIHSDKGQNQ